MSAGTGETGSPWVRVSSASQMIMPALARLPRAQQEAAPPQACPERACGYTRAGRRPGAGSQSLPGTPALLPSCSLLGTDPKAGPRIPEEPSPGWPSAAQPREARVLEWLDAVTLAVKTEKKSGWEQLGVDVLDRKLSGHSLGNVPDGSTLTLLPIPKASQPAPS